MDFCFPLPARARFVFLHEQGIGYHHTTATLPRRRRTAHVGTRLEAGPFQPYTLRTLHNLIITLGRPVLPRLTHRAHLVKPLANVIPISLLKTLCLRAVREAIMRTVITGIPNDDGRTVRIPLGIVGPTKNLMADHLLRWSQRVPRQWTIAHVSSQRSPSNTPSILCTLRSRADFADSWSRHSLSTS